jgi:hypothetical protein
LPSRCGVALLVMKNWDVLVFGPLLAQLSRPRLSCAQKTSSSFMVLPQTLSPPVPFPLVMSPPCTMKFLRMRWNLAPAYVSFLPVSALVLSPPAMPAKFSAERGHSSA